MNVILTIGHSTRTLETFISLVKHNNVTMTVDIRTVPRSRYNPQFNSDTLPTALGLAGIKYEHMSGLGGLRRPLPDSPNSGWRNATFRGFADYMQTAEFAHSLQQLISLATEELTALMCAEALPWRCHRSLIADALAMQGIPVKHILSSAVHRVHVITP